MPILPNQQTEVSQPTEKPSFLKSKKFIAAIIFLAILIAIILTLFIFASKKQSSTAQNYTLSTQDKQNQQVIKKLTGFDWTNYPKHPNNSEEQSLASLMLLYSEETAVFYPEARNIAKPDTTALELTPIDPNPTKQNMIKLIDSLEKVENYYKDNGLLVASYHLKRLNSLKSYFSKQQIDQKEEIPKQASEISSNIVVGKNQEEYTRAIIKRFNNWLNQ